MHDGCVVLVVDDGDASGGEGGVVGRVGRIGARLVVGDDAELHAACVGNDQRIAQGGAVEVVECGVDAGLCAGDAVEQGLREGGDGLGVGGRRQVGSEVGGGVCTGRAKRHKDQREGDGCGQESGNGTTDHRGAAASAAGMGHGYGGIVVRGRGVVTGQGDRIEAEGVGGAGLAVTGAAGAAGSSRTHWPTIPGTLWATILGTTDGFSRTLCDSINNHAARAWPP